MPTYAPRPDHLLQLRRQRETHPPARVTTAPNFASRTIGDLLRLLLPHRCPRPLPHSASPRSLAAIIEPMPHAFDERAARLSCAKPAIWCSPGGTRTAPARRIERRQHHRRGDPRGAVLREHRQAQGHPARSEQPAPTAQPASVSAHRLRRACTAAAHSLYSFTGPVYSRGLERRRLNTSRATVPGCRAK